MLLEEVEQVQNPGLGAAIISCFVRGYESRNNGDSIPLTYAFIVVPMLFNKNILNQISSTNKGLRKLDEKLADNQSVLATLQESVLALRSLSQKSLALAMQARLLTVEPDMGTMRSRSTPSMPARSENSRKMLRAAEKLGVWASQVTLQEFCFIFQLEL